MCKQLLDFLKVFFSFSLSEGPKILSKLLSLSPSPPRPPSPRPSCSSPTARFRCERALPDLNRELQISAGTARSRLRAPDLSGHCQTSAASSRSQRALPDLDCELQISAGTAGNQLRSGHARQCPCQGEGQNKRQVVRQKKSR